MKEKKKHDELLAEAPEGSTSERRRPNTRQDTADEGQSDLRDLIARRAYQLYEERGRSDGEDMSDWLRAEAEVKSAVGATDPGKLDPARKRRQMSPRAGAGQ